MRCQWLGRLFAAWLRLPAVEEPVEEPVEQPVEHQAALQGAFQTVVLNSAESLLARTMNPDPERKFLSDVDHLNDPALLDHPAAPVRWCRRL